VDGNEVSNAALDAELNELVVDLGAQFVRFDLDNDVLEFRTLDVTVSPEQMQTLADTIAQIVSTSSSPAIKSTLSKVRAVRVTRS
jgi:hypothetical protein